MPALLVLIHLLLAAGAEAKLGRPILGPLRTALPLGGSMCSQKRVAMTLETDTPTCCFHCSEERRMGTARRLVAVCSSSISAAKLAFPGLAALISATLLCCDCCRCCRRGCATNAQAVFALARYRSRSNLSAAFEPQAAWVASPFRNCARQCGPLRCIEF